MPIDLPGQIDRYAELERIPPGEWRVDVMASFLRSGLLLLEFASSALLRSLDAASSPR